MTAPDETQRIHIRLDADVVEGLTRIAQPIGMTTPAETLRCLATLLVRNPRALAVLAGVDLVQPAEPWRQIDAAEMPQSISAAPNRCRSAQDERTESADLVHGLRSAAPNRCRRDAAEMPLSTGSSETGDLRPARASSDDEDDEDDHHLEIQEASRGDVAEAARLLGRQGSGETIPADAAAALVQIHRENLALVDAGDRRPIARPRSWARKVFAGLLADPAQVRDALGRRGKLLEEAARARDERHKTLERSDARLRARNAALDEVSSWSGEERIRQARALKLPPAQIPMLERDEPPGFVLEELADLWLASGATTGGRSASGQPREGPSEAPGEPIGTPGGGAGVSAAVRGLAGSKSAPTVRRHKRPKRRR